MIKECYIETFTSYEDAELWTGKIAENFLKDENWEFEVSIISVNNQFRASVLGRKDQLELVFDE